MNVFDFDNTILNGDTEEMFFNYLITTDYVSKLYKLKVKILKKLRLMKLYSPMHYYPSFYSCFKHIKNINYIVDKFWLDHYKDIKKWYIDKHKDSDVVVSATARILLIPAMKYLNITRLIATEVNLKKGKTIGYYCYGKEKVVRFLKEYDLGVIDEFYSDSESDKYLAAISNKAYKVEGDNISFWPVKKSF